MACCFINELVCTQPSPARLCILLQNINLPLTGDDTAIKKYAGEVEALKKQIGMPDVEDVRPAAWRGMCLLMLRCSGMGWAAPVRCSCKHKQHVDVLT
jgi:hypothetical protein